MKLANILCAGSFALAAGLCTPPHVVRAAEPQASAPKSPKALLSRMDTLTTEGIDAARAGKCAVTQEKWADMAAILGQISRAEIRRGNDLTPTGKAMRQDVINLSIFDHHCLIIEAPKDFSTCHALAIQQKVPLATRPTFIEQCQDHKQQPAPPR